ncbi:MAG: hypothetical protein SFY32_16140 [Bacteroidota bacterium]|nr:hypothetical protein [Bacteroidota bacterium]
MNKTTTHEKLTLHLYNELPVNQIDELQFQLLLNALLYEEKVQSELMIKQINKCTYSPNAYVETNVLTYASSRG